jgi:oxygen-independent coproporphyrinogen-3 oxidase
VHLPFCAAKCHYCDFFSVAAEGHDRGAMIAAILREAELRAPLRPRTVYLGGGTPSLLSIEELRRLLDGLDSLTRFRESAVEVTAECNPESLDRDKARALLDLGVRRLSIGFQSLHDEVLQLFGRVHSVADSFRAFDAARSAGVESLNVDLIYAVPGQDPDAWGTDLARVLGLGPEHLSAYNLTFEEETLFRRWLEEGRLAREPEEVELRLFEVTREVVAAHGLEAYEISNFASKGRQCRHNVNYWRNGPYVGIGPSAVSKLGCTRTGNVKGISTYTRRILDEGSAADWHDSPSADTRLAESWWLGLRLEEGITPKEARERAGFEARIDPALPIAERMREEGLLDRVTCADPSADAPVGAPEDRYRLTRRGRALADHVAKRFLHGAG